ncbi:MAG TPA: PadR family transcriptional regulator [Longimicrobiales bacterium]|nr:PadR family transcriptional regulator [Longimicrobiales bacterium]
MTPNRADIEALLPLPAAAYHILLVLSTGDRHGYGIAQDVETATGGAVRLSPGTLYRTIQRLLEQGLIMEPRVATIDPRRRPYRLTAFGLAVARAESHRLADLVRLAEGAGLLLEAT